EVPLALLAVPQHVNVLGVIGELLVEIVDVPVAVALAEDRDESEDEAAEVEPRGVRLDQSLAGELAGAIERRLHGKGRVLRRREDRRLAVDRAGGGEGDAGDGASAHR